MTTPAPRSRRRANGRRLGIIGAIAASVVGLPIALVWGLSGYSPVQGLMSLQAATAAAPRDLPPAAAALPPLRGPAVVDADTSKLPLIDVLTTRSGRWKLYDAGRDATLARYVWTLDENPRFVRVMVCKRAFTHENGDGDALDLTPVAASVRHNGTRHAWDLTVAQGACRVAQNMDPVAPNPEWLKQAVAKLRIPAYRRERSFRTMPSGKFKLRFDEGYDPASLGGESSAKNYVGVTSPQGGEYTSSRGFLHNADAVIVDSVLHAEPLDRAWDTFTAYTWYSLAHPSGAVWSPVNHVTVDPQFPQAGDRPWEIANGGDRARRDIDSVIPAKRWNRDVSHLENTGFVHWILTEDPVAGLVVQRQAAYALSGWYEYKRKRGDRSYRAFTEQERGSYNMLSALWKSRDVSMRVASRRGSVIWRPIRTEKMAADAIADLHARRAVPALTAPADGSSDHIRRIVGLPLRGLGVQTWKTTDGGELKLRGASAFELPQYGKEPLYLWTRAGDPRAARWFAMSARHLVVRTLHVGGARGIDRAENMRGSTYPIAPLGPPPYTTDVGWARWVKSLPIVAGPTDRFDGASIHTLTQIQGTLLLAKAAGLKVPELDAALAKIDADRSRTAEYRYSNLDMAKHWAAPR